MTSAKRIRITLDPEIDRRIITAIDELSKGSNDSRAVVILLHELMTRRDCSILSSSGTDMDLISTANGPQDTSDENLMAELGNIFDE